MTVKRWVVSARSGMSGGSEDSRIEYFSRVVFEAYVGLVGEEADVSEEKVRIAVGLLVLRVTMGRFNRPDGMRPRRPASLNNVLI